MERVRVVPYDPSWPDRYAEAADELRAALAGVLRTIEHVGSTAVPGLVAKPVIDIAVSVESLQQLDVQALVVLGYCYVPEYEQLLPDRRYFKRPGLHVHIYEREHEEFMDYLRFRDYLRTHPEDRDAYAALKLELARDLEPSKYQKAKAPFVERLVRLLRSG